MGDAFRVPDYRELFFAGKVVADVAVLDDRLGWVSTFAVTRERTLDKNRNRYRRSCPLPKNIVFFFSTKFSLSPRIPPQVENVNLAKFPLEAFAETVHRVRIYPAAVRDEPDDAAALRVDAVGCPAERLDVAVVERVLVRRGTPLRIALVDAGVQIRVLLVLRVVVCGLLPHGIRRVSDHHLDGRALLGAGARAVHRENVLAEILLAGALRKLETVREANPFERRKFRGTARVVVGVLDVHARDVVGEQHDFVRLDFLSVFAFEVLPWDQPALDKPSHESSRARERIDDVHVLVGKAPPELHFQDVVDASDDEIDAFHRRIDNAQFFDRFRERAFKELVVKLDDDFLLALGAFDAFRAELHAVHELFEAPLVAIFRHVLDDIDNALERPRNGILPGEVVAVKEGFENGPRDQVLREHLDSGFLVYARVQVLLERGKEPFEFLFRPGIGP